MELNETNICVDRVSVAISSEMFDNYVFWTESLGNPLANIRDYGSIKTLAANHHVLEFSFKENEFITAKADGYYYQDYSGFFRMINGIIGEVFKIKGESVL